MKKTVAMFRATTSSFVWLAYLVCTGWRNWCGWSKSWRLPRRSSWSKSVSSQSKWTQQSRVWSKVWSQRCFWPTCLRAFGSSPPSFTTSVMTPGSPELESEVVSLASCTYGLYTGQLKQSQLSGMVTFQRSQTLKSCSRSFGCWLEWFSTLSSSATFLQSSQGAVKFKSRSHTESKDWVSWHAKLRFRTTRPSRSSSTSSKTSCLSSLRTKTSSWSRHCLRVCVMRFFWLPTASWSTKLTSLRMWMTTTSCGRCFLALKTSSLQKVTCSTGEATTPMSCTLSQVARSNFTLREVPSSSIKTVRASEIKTCYWICLVTVKLSQ